MKIEKIIQVLALSAFFLLMVILTFPCCKNYRQGDAVPGPDTPEDPPTVTTNTITNISNIYATGGGDVISGGSSPVTERGVCWHISQDPETTDSRTNNGTGTGGFTSNLQILTPNTTYYVRAYAVNSFGTSYGNQVSFTTAATGNAPSVITNEVTNISDTAANCGGVVIAPGSSPVTAFGVCWSTVRPDISDPHTNDGAGVGTFSSYMHGLSANTIYYVRAYATNGEETGYGNEVSFNTSTGTDGNPCPGLPTITDPRDGQVYPTVQVGAQCWLLKNMNFQMDSSWCYENSGSNCNTYGLLYNWDAALTACPPGWHLPSNDEWGNLFAYLGNGAGGKLKEAGSDHWTAPNAGATNESGYTALPGGFRWVDGHFSSIGLRGHFWSSTEYEEAELHAYYVKLVQEDAKIYHYWNFKAYANSVRCVKD